MRVIAIVRNENRGVVEALLAAGHRVTVQEQVAPVMPPECDSLPWPNERSGMRGYAGMSVTEKINALIPAMAQIIDTLNAREYDALLVWTDAIPTTRCAVLASRKRGIPTFEVTHGAFNTYRQGHFECESYVDVILAPGQEEADFREFYGSAAEVIVTGKPSFDWIATCDRAAQKEVIKERWQIPAHRPVVLYGMTWRHPFSTWERDSDRGEWDVYSAHLNLLPVCKPFLLVKPHYVFESELMVKRLHYEMEQMGVVEYAIVGGPTRDILPACDLVVSHKSSLLVEAVLLDIPALGFDFRERNDFAFYPNLGIEWCSDRLKLLETMTRCLLDFPTKDRLNTEREAAKHYFNGPNDGLAAERCTTTIEQVVSARMSEVA